MPSSMMAVKGRAHPALYCSRSHTPPDTTPAANAHGQKLAHPDVNISSGFVPPGSHGAGSFWGILKLKLVIPLIAVSISVSGASRLEIPDVSTLGGVH